MNWLRRARAVLVMGVVWAGGGAAIGGIIELLANIVPGGFSFASRVDMWPQTLAIPGFIAGILFAILLMIGARHRRLDELSLPAITGLGAAAGVLLGMIAMLIGAPLAFVAITALFGALGGTVSLGVVRLAGRRERLPGTEPTTRLGESTDATTAHPQGRPHDLR